jgi:plasmid stability protein
MSSVTIRNLPEATHRSLKLRAQQHGRSTEAEIRFILEQAVAPVQGLGDALAAIGRDVGGLDLAISRDQRPVDAASFE